MLVLLRGECLRGNYDNDVIIVWAHLMSSAAVAILNTSLLRKTPPVPFQKDQKKLLEQLYAAKTTAGLDTTALCGFGSFGAST